MRAVISLHMFTSFSQVFPILCFTCLLPPAALGDWSWENDVADLQTDGGRGIAQFHFQNLGATTLPVIDLVSSCQCTQFTFESKETGAGDRGTLTIILEDADRETRYEFLALGKGLSPTVLRVKVPGEERMETQP